MLFSTKMMLAWKQADDFNKVIPIGTTVLYDDKEHITADHAYVLASGEVVVLLHKINSPISLSKIQVPEEILPLSVSSPTNFHSFVPLTANNPYLIPFTP